MITSPDGGPDRSPDHGAALYRLLSWLSPAYPVGAFAYSQGLETAVAAGLVHDADSTRDWILDLMARGSLWSDAVIFARAQEAAQQALVDQALAEAVEGSGRAAGRAALAEVNDFALAFQPGAELKRESLALGAAFLAVTRRAWPCAAFELLERRPDGPESRPGVAYPVAVATAAAGHGVAPDAALEAWLHAGAANSISAAVRLVPLGQSAGQEILAALEPEVAATALKARLTRLADLTTASLAAEICSMNHETQHTRLFRS